MTTFKIGDMVIQKEIGREGGRLGYTERAKGIIGKVVGFSSDQSMIIAVDLGPTFNGHTAGGSCPNHTGYYYYSNELNLVNPIQLESINDDYKLLYE